MPHLLAVPTHNVPKPAATSVEPTTTAEPTATTAEPTATTTEPTTTTSVLEHITLWAVSSHMPRYIAHIADRLVLTITY